MFTIYKYPIFDGITWHNIPKGGKVLHANHQKGYIQIWVEVNTEKPNEARRFRYFTTGEVIHPEPGTYYRYIDTIVIRETNDVVHVYEIESQV
jgi:hypothetical protein